MTDLDAVDAMMEGVTWFSIETAPRDGTWFVARSAHGQVRFVHYDDEHDWYPISHDSVCWSYPPIEWTIARELVPALAAEVRAQQATIENLRQMERNVQAVREFEHQRAEKALATIAALEKRVEVLTGALASLEKQASITANRGAVTGPHWTHLTIACLKARVALKETPHD